MQGVEKLVEINWLAHSFERRGNAPGGREVAGSSPVIPTNAKVKVLIFSTLTFFNTQICTTFAQHLLYLEEEDVVLLFD